MTADPSGSTAAAIANLDILRGVNRTGKYFLYEGTLEFVMLRYVLNPSESCLGPLHCKRDGIFMSIVIYVTKVLHHRTFYYYNRSSVAPRLISPLRQLKFLKNRISYCSNSESSFNIEILIIALSGNVHPQPGPVISAMILKSIQLYYH